MKSENKIGNFYNFEEDSIELTEIIKTIWLNRLIILKASIYSFVFGCLVAILSPTVYQSHTTFVPQTSDQSSQTTNKSLGSLASLAGINLNAESSSSLDNYISPLLYSKVVESLEFSLDLLDENIYLEDNTKITIKDYLLKNSKFSLIGFIKRYTIDLIKSKESTKISDDIAREFNIVDEKEYYLTESLKSKFEIEANDQEGYIMVTATDKNALISAQILKIITKNLQSRIINLRTNKIREQLSYSEEQYFKKKNEFESLQVKLAKFRDSNKNISTAIFYSELEKLETEYSLQRNILISLATEYNNNKIKLNKDTPIFSVLDEVSVPIERYRPKRTILVIIFTLIGMFASVFYTLSHIKIKSLIKTIKGS